jgi:hypothetical protein
VTSRAAPTKVISKRSAFCYRIALEEDSQAVLILGHESGFPASPASLIEKIGESIFIFAGMSRELHHYSLVFFHRELEIMSP